MERSRKRSLPIQGYGWMDQARPRWIGGEWLVYTVNGAKVGGAEPGDSECAGTEA